MGSGGGGRVGGGGDEVSLVGGGAFGECYQPAAIVILLGRVVGTPVMLSVVAAPPSLNAYESSVLIDVSEP